MPQTRDQKRRGAIERMTYKVSTYRSKAAHLQRLIAGTATESLKALRDHDEETNRYREQIIAGLERKIATLDRDILNTKAALSHTFLTTQ